MLPQVFTGRHPFGKLIVPIITSKIVGSRRPARPQEAQELGLTDSVWGMAVRCWHQDPAQRPTMTEVVRLAREWPVFSLFLWNQHHDMLPAATGWLRCGLRSRIFRSRSWSTTFYLSVKPRIYSPLVVPTGSSPSSSLVKCPGEKS